MERIITDEEIKQNENHINDAMSRGDLTALLGHIAASLYRMANAQEVIASAHTKDIDEAIEAAVRERAETRAAEMVEENSKRSYIGKKHQ